MGRVVGEGVGGRGGRGWWPICFDFLDFLISKKLSEHILIDTSLVFEKCSLKLSHFHHFAHSFISFDIIC